jgi:hypothetical protein
MSSKKGFNDYKIVDGLVYMFLYKRNGDVYITVFYEKHLEKIKKLDVSWNLWWNKDTETYYCRATKYIRVINGKSKNKSIYLHKAILDFPKVLIDHKNHDTLDNRDENLREATKKLNATHREGENKNNKSGYRNVSWIHNWYRIQLQIDGKNYMFPEKFKDVEEAAKFAEEMRQKYYGEFAGN